jgi:hypothetical protein
MTRGAVSRPALAPSVSCPQPPTDTACPAVGETAEPSISRPDTVPLPSVAATLVAVIAPPNSETEESVTWAVLHVEPLAVEELNATTESDAG